MTKNRVEFKGGPYIHAIDLDPYQLQIQVTDKTKTEESRAVALPKSKAITLPKDKPKIRTEFGTVAEEVLAHGLARFQDTNCRIGYGAVYGIEGNKLSFYVPSVHELFPNGTEAQAVSQFLELLTHVGVDKTGTPSRVMDKPGVTPLLTPENFKRAIEELGLPQPALEAPDHSVDSIEPAGRMKRIERGK